MAKKQTLRPPKPKVIKSTAIVVLGMHRSGTSALSGVLSKLGCSEPATLIAPTPNNVKGFFESQPFSDLLDKVLETGDSTWQDWRPFNPNWMQSLVAEPFIKEAVELLGTEYGKSKLFVFKNPRICRLMPFFTSALEQLDATPLFVLTHRNPIEVAASLTRRNKLQPAHGHLLWLRHVLDAEFSTRGHARYFTSYASILADWGVEMTQLQDVLGVTFPRSVTQVRKGVASFLSSDLRNFTEPSTIPLGNLEVSEWTRSVFEILERWTGSAGDKNDFERLDEIRHQFDAMALNFEAIVQDGMNLPKVKSDAASTLAATKSKLTEIEGQLTSTTAALEKQTVETPAKLEELNKTHAVKVAEITAEREAAQVKAQADADALQDAQNLIASTTAALEKQTIETPAKLEELNKTHAVKIAEITAEREVAQVKAQADAEALQDAHNLIASTTAALEKQTIETPAKLEELNRTHAVKIAQITAEKEALQIKAQADADAQSLLQDQFSTTQSMLEQRSHEAEQTHNELTVAHATFEEKFSEAAVREATLQDELNARFGELAELSILEMTAQKALSQHQIEATQTSAELTEAHAKIKDVEMDRDQRLKQMMIKEAELNREMQVRFDELADLGALLVESNAEREKVVAALTKERMAAQKEQRHVGEVISQKDTEYHDLKVKTQAADIALQTITSSTSWKLTAPLRKIINKFRPSR